MLGLLEAARDEGLDVTFDSYPYVYSSTRLLIMFPDWVHNGGPELFVQRSGHRRRVSVCARKSCPAVRAGVTSG